MLLLLLLIILLLLLFQYFRILYRNRYAAQIPSIEPSYPLVGNIPLFWAKNTEQAFRVHTRCTGQVDRLGKFSFGPLLVLVVTHPDLLQELLTRHDLCDKPFFYDFYELGGGLITERSGEKWRPLRRILSPTFNVSMLSNFLPTMDGRARKMIAKLRPLADGRTELDLLQYVGECALEMVFSTTMGRNASELPGQRDYVQHLRIIMQMVGERIMNANQVFYGVLYKLTKASRLEQRSRKVCRKFTEKIIQDRRLELLKDQKVLVKDDEFHRKSLNFLDQILTIQKDDGTGFTDQEIIHHLDTIISAASDTTALTTANTLLFLAIYPHLQNKVLAELNEVFPSTTAPITLETLNQLRYTEQVIKETLRIYPSAPIEGRQTSREITLDGFRIPAQQILITSFYTLHRRPELWGPEPERFDPDRFAPEACRERHPYAYLPFSGGLRNCLGSRYAMIAMKVLLLRVLQAFEVRTELKQSDLRFKFEVSLKLVGPHRVWLVRRDTKPVASSISINAVQLH